MNFKHNKSRQRVKDMHPTIAMIMFLSSLWAEDRGLPFVVTETVTTEADDRAVNRKHKTHQEGRAFDFSIKGSDGKGGWTTDDMTDYFIDMNERYGHLGAVSKSTGQRSLVVFHGKGENLHGHVQVGRDVIEDQPYLTEY